MFKYLALAAMLVGPLVPGAAAQDPSRNPRTVCIDTPVVPPTTLPPANSPPVVFLIVPCFPKQDNVTLIDPAAPVARELKRRLESAGLLAEGERTGRETFWTSGSGEAIARIRQLWGADADVHALPNGSSSSVSAASATVPK